jgi:hypothetical protein
MLLMLNPFLDLLIKNAGMEVFEMGPIMTISLIIVVFAIVMVLALRAVAMIGQGWGVDQQRSQAPPSERIASAEAQREGARPGRTEQLVERASTSDIRGASGVSAIYASHASITRRSGEISDALTLSTTDTGPRLGQAYKRAPQLATQRGGKT